VDANSLNDKSKTTNVTCGTADVSENSQVIESVEDVVQNSEVNRVDSDIEFKVRSFTATRYINHACFARYYGLNK
jgi:hypothetical protein